MSLLITPDTKIGLLIDEYPFLLDFLPTLHSEYKKLGNPLMRKTMGKIVTVGKAAKTGGIPVLKFISFIEKEVKRRTADGSFQAEERPLDQEKIEELKAIITELHQGGDVEELKKRFNDLIEDVSPVEIPKMEQKLIDEGMPTEEIAKLSSLHVQIFKDALDRHDREPMPPGHPIHTFMKENAEAERLCKEIMSIVDGTGDGSTADLAGLVEELGKVDLHYLRKENQLFPRLEDHGITGPSKVMWEAHDDIRALLKTAREGREDNQGPALQEMVAAVRDMFFKEESILFPLCKETLTESDWVQVRNGEEEIGYAWIEPDKGWAPVIEDTASESGATAPIDGMVKLDTGVMPVEALNLMLKHLSVDIQFVDAQDRVAYYSDTQERIFPRSPGVIGREVRSCHPPKSVDIVSRILEEFRAGNRDDADFWITLNGRFLYIKYTAVRDAEGKILFLFVNILKKQLV